MTNKTELETKLKKKYKPKITHFINRLDKKRGKNTVKMRLTLTNTKLNPTIVVNMLESLGYEFITTETHRDEIDNSAFTVVIFSKNKTDLININYVPETFELWLTGKFKGEN